MSQLTATAIDHLPSNLRPAAILRGGARGLEIVVDGGATAEAIAEAVTSRIAEAPGFFRGNDVRIRVDDGPLAAGCLARLDAIAEHYELRIVEVGAGKRGEAAPVIQLAVGTAPVAPESGPVEEPAQGVLPRIDPGAPAPAPAPAAPERASEPPAAPPQPPSDQLELELAAPAAKLVVGPVRSGVILEHRGHLIVVGDVNPGAEVRATGNIIVLGRLRGTAHAGIASDAAAFILALRLEPQQLRIGRSVARANDSEHAADTLPEIAHLAGKTIVVERYQGRLPPPLVASI